MKIGIASDHRGFVKKRKLIKYLTKKGHEVVDYGTNSKEIVDFPKYSFIVGEAIIKNEIELGIVMCGTGIGVSIAANKVKGIRCAKINNAKEAKLAKFHNNANMVAIGSNNYTFLIKDMLDAFIKTKISQKERYDNRNNQILEYEGYKNV